MKKNISKGPMLPLAILAIIIVMVPVFVVSNTRTNISNAEAASRMKVTLPTNEPHVEVDDMNVERPTPAASATPKSYPVRTSPPVYY